MTLEDRSRCLMYSQKKKNWFDFSKVTGGALWYKYSQRLGSYSSVSGDKYITNMAAAGEGIVMYDSRTVLPKGDYVFSFTVYAPVAKGIYYRVVKYISDNDTSPIAVSGYRYDLKAETYTNYSLPFSVDEETTVLVGVQAVGDSSNMYIKYEVSNIRIEKVG